MGFIAGANYKMGREGFEETMEPKAPKSPDDMKLGTTVHWFAELKNSTSKFPVCDWAIQFTEEYYLKNTRGEWDWETGFYWDTVEDAEKIRDHSFRAIYGHWSFLKNHRVQ